MKKRLMKHVGWIPIRPGFSSPEFCTIRQKHQTKAQIKNMKNGDLYVPARVFIEVPEAEE